MFQDNPLGKLVASISQVNCIWMNLRILSRLQKRTKRAKHKSHWNTNRQETTHQPVEDHKKKPTEQDKTERDEDGREPDKETEKDTNGSPSGTSAEEEQNPNEEQNEVTQTAEEGGEKPPQGENSDLNEESQEVPPPETVANHEKVNSEAEEGHVEPSGEKNDQGK